MTQPSIRSSSLLALTLSLAACSGGDAPARAGAVDFSRPEAVLSAVFEAARSGDAAQLASLCAPDADGDARRVCAAEPSHEKWPDFRKHFTKGAVKGAPRIDGAAAEVDFTFGPDGTRPETMRLVQVDGRWLLSGF